MILDAMFAIFAVFAIADNEASIRRVCASGKFPYIHAINPIFQSPVMFIFAADRDWIVAVSAGIMSVMDIRILWHWWNRRNRKRLSLPDRIVNLGHRLIVQPERA